MVVVVLCVCVNLQVGLAEVFSSSKWHRLLEQRQPV
jgi:hypothetical protein